MSEYESVIASIISSVSGAEESSIAEEAVLREIGINSIMFIEIIVKLEQKLEFEFDNDDLAIEHIKTVRDLFKLVEKNITRIR